MYIYYDKNSDYLELFFETVANYADADETNESVAIFRSEKDDSIVGYALDNASKEIQHFDRLDPIDKLAALIKIARQRRDWSQEEVAQRLGISLRHYQRLEGGQDTTLSVLSELATIFPETEFGVLLEKKRTA